MPTMLSWMLLINDDIIGSVDDDEEDDDDGSQSPAGINGVASSARRAEINGSCSRIDASNIDLLYDSDDVDDAHEDEDAAAADESSSINIDDE